MYVPQKLLRTQAGDRREKGHWFVIKKRDRRNANDESGEQISKEDPVFEQATKKYEILEKDSKDRFQTSKKKKLFFLYHRQDKPP